MDFNGIMCITKLTITPRDVYVLNAVYRMILSLLHVCSCPGGVVINVSLIIRRGCVTMNCLLRLP